jgi:GT2 family glycosyltransferase
VPTSVEVCLCSRDGRFDRDVMVAAEAACVHAANDGIGCELAVAVDQYGVAPVRNRGAAAFLGRDHTHLLFVDDDVILPVAAVTLLAQAAARHPGDLIGGCVPSLLDGHKPYVQVAQVGGDGWADEWPESDVEAQRIGGGCMLIPRGLFTLVGCPWFRWVERYVEGRGLVALSDDVDFCNRVREGGRRVWATGAVRCGHKKQIDVAALIGGPT